MENTGNSRTIHLPAWGKQVFRFNCRWPNLRTFPPAHYCVDEIVQIAEGLYLGQFTYATELLKKYDPA